MTREPGDLPSSAVTCGRVGRGASTTLGCVTFAIGQLAVTDGCREDFVPDTYRRLPDACGGDTATRFLIPFLMFIAGYGGCVGNAVAHGIAGNRLFVGTLSFADPAVADEFQRRFLGSSSWCQEGCDRYGDQHSVFAIANQRSSLPSRCDLDKSRQRWRFECCRV